MLVPLLVGAISVPLFVAMVALGGLVGVAFAAVVRVGMWRGYLGLFVGIALPALVLGSVVSPGAGFVFWFSSLLAGLIGRYFFPARAEV